MAQKTKGIFTPEQEDKLSQIADAAIQAKNPIVEAVDGVAIKAGIRFLDNVIIDKMDDEKQLVVAEYIGEVVDAL